MKRYIMFCGYNHEAMGGMGDSKFAGDSMEECMALYAAHKADFPGWSWDWYHFFDLQTGEVIDEEGTRRPWN